MIAIGSLLIQTAKVPVPLPDYLYDALIDLYKNGLPRPGQRTVAQQEARIKKVRYLYLIPQGVIALIKMLILIKHIINYNGPLFSWPKFASCVEDSFLNIFNVIYISDSSIQYKKQQNVAN